MQHACSSMAKAISFTGYLALLPGDVSSLLWAAQVAGLFTQGGSYVPADFFNFLVKIINKTKAAFKKPQFPVQMSRITCALNKQSLETLICYL